MPLSGSLHEKLQTRRRLPSPAERLGLRKAAGVSQGDLAAELGCTYVTVGRWERGEHAPRGRMLTRYVEILDELRRLTDRGGAAW